MAQRNTPDTVEILSIGRIEHPHYGDDTCLDVLFMLPVATYGRSVFRARIWDAGDGVYYFEHYASEGGIAFDTLYYRALPDGYDWADWAAQMTRDTAALCGE